MKMKKPIILGSIIALLGTSAVFANTNVFMNGEYLQFKDAKPIIRNERTTVPVSAIAKNLGINYTWNNDTKTVTFKQDDKELNLKIGEENSFVENGRTYVPLKFIAEHFDQEVDWRVDTKTVVIGDNAKDLAVPEIEKPKEETKATETKKYNELSDFKSTHISKSEIFKDVKDIYFNVYDESKGGMAEKLKNVYHLKKEDLPLRIANVVITKLEKDKTSDNRDVIMVSGYVLEDTMSTPTIISGFIDNNKLYRHRNGFFGLDMEWHNHFIKKYPDLKGLNDSGMYLSVTNTGEKFTYMLNVFPMGTEMDYGDFRIKEIDKIVIYSSRLGKDIVVFDNFLK